MVDFGQIADAIATAMDTDRLDIWRGRVKAHSDIPCHIAIVSADKPDPAAVDVAPIATTLRIHMANGVDIRNNDYLVAKRTAHGGELIAAYGGVCGYPAASQARQSVTMQMASILPTATPPDAGASVLPATRFIRLLLNGAYTRSDGAAANGYHLCGNIAATDVTELPAGAYALTTTAATVKQTDAGTATIAAGSTIRLYPSDRWLTVSDVTRDGDQWSIAASEYAPTAQEAAAQVTEWYDD